MTQNKSFLTSMLDSSLGRMLIAQHAKTEIQANSITKNPLEVKIENLYKYQLKPL